MPKRARAESGVTLVETLVAVAILGSAFTALLGGFTTAAITSDVHRKQSTVSTVIRSYASAVQATTYVDCPAPFLVGYTPPSGYTVSITSTEYWVSGTTNPPSFSGCTVDTGLQKYTLQAQSADGKAVETMTVYKRKPCTPSAPC